MKIILYISNFNKIGGVEKFVINFYKRIPNVTVLYDNGSPNIGERIKWNKIYYCDIFISASAWGKSAFNNVDSKIYVQMVHADYRHVISTWDFKYNKHPKTTHHVCVGELVKEAFEEATPYKCDAVIHNLLDNSIEYEEKPKNDILNLITVSRLSGEKGFGRMLKLANQLDEKQIPYVWNIFGDDSATFGKNLIKTFSNCKSVFFRGITTEPFKEINKADYLVQLSDTEGFAYSVYEAMQVKTPCLITPFASGKEQITNGINGYILPFDMENIPFDDILRRDLVVPDFNELGKNEHWINFFNFALDEFYKNNPMVKIKILVEVSNPGVKVGDIIEVSEERATMAIDKGYAEVYIEPNDINVNEPIEVKKKRKTTKK